MKLSGLHAAAALAALAVGACETSAPAPAPAQSAGTANRSILEWTRPAAGSTVSGPVNEIQFHFSPPARLGEVTVTGPGGIMPMMVTAVGEVEHYSIPASALGPGAYTVNWKATTAGREHNGSFGFTVR